MGLYFLSRVSGWLERRRGAAADAAPSANDPIDHPAIAAMSLIELADLPLWPERGEPEGDATGSQRGRKLDCAR